jgi:hypothetical protein
MGWGSYFLLGDLGQQLDLEQQRQEIENLRSRLGNDRASVAASVEARLNVLQRDNNQNTLYLAAITRLLVSKQIVTRQEVENMVTAIDREDGKEDGRFQPSQTRQAPNDASKFA